MGKFQGGHSTRVGALSRHITGSVPPRLCDTVGVCGIQLGEKDSEQNAHQRVCCKEDSAPSRQRRLLHRDAREPVSPETPRANYSPRRQADTENILLALHHVLGGQASQGWSKQKHECCTMDIHSRMWKLLVLLNTGLEK